MKAKRKTNDYIFCSVEFSESGKSYYYTTEDDALEIGDDVLVPVGNDGHTAIVRIVNVEYFPEDKVPFPLDKVKSIIGKCTDDELNPPILNSETSADGGYFCPLYNGNINRYDCDEISCGAKHGWMPNDGLPKLMDIEIIQKKRELCLACERHKNAPEKQAYSDAWKEQGYACGHRINVSDVIDYRIWSDDKGATIGVTVNFETADDFHYELRTEDWSRFLCEVLCINDTSVVTEAFQGFLKAKTDLFAFEESLNKRGIKYRKIAFY